MPSTTGPVGRLRRLQAACGRCPLATCSGPVALPSGRHDARVFLIDEPPAPDDDESFAGARGRMLDKLLLSAGLDRRDCFLTSYPKCRPPGRPFRAAELAACKRWTWRELKLVRPRVVVAMGTAAARLVTRSRRPADLGPGPIDASYIDEGSVAFVLPSAASLLRGGMGRVEEAVRVLRKCRRHLEADT